MKLEKYWSRILNTCRFKEVEIRNRDGTVRSNFQFAQRHHHIQTLFWPFLLSKKFAALR